MSLLRYSVAILTLGLGACDSLGAHASVVAKAGARELSVDRLGNLIGQSAAPVRKDVARSIAEVWVDYQLLAEAAAAGDTLGDLKLVDETMAPVMQRARIDALFQEVSKAWKDKPLDSTGLEGRYNNGEFLAARHILIPVTQGSPPDSVSKFQAQASQLAKQLNAGNFAAMAQKFSKDPSSAQRGGDLGIFPKGAMVPEFERGLLNLKPGEISAPIRTSFGYHLIRRATYPEVKAEVAKAALGKQLAAAESTYLAKLETDGKIDIKNDAALTAKAVAIDLEGHFDDKTVIATMKGGDYTAAMLAKLMRTLPEKNQLITQLPQLPDSIIIGRFVKAVVRAELLSREADAKGIKTDTALVGNVHRAFFNMVKGAWNGLGIAPAMLDSAGKAPADAKLKLAADRVEAFMDGLIKQQVQFVEVPPPLEAALRMKYKSSIDKAGIDRAVEKAQKVRTAADSAKAKSEPPSAVPVPAPAPAAPAPGTKKP
ncbi:MAG: peptidyl-prolyl cis-trans isomerase [Gemmatimonadetes bacterium]|nr:peptidyl-prolyl cis-trans isomerase [Gemmatimonadota bacterium]